MKLALLSKMLLVATLMTVSIAPYASAADGALSSDDVDRIRSSFKMDAHTRAMYNAITNNDVEDLALNRDLLRQHNDLFSHTIDVKGVTNQKKSGRCWLFAGLNVLRPVVIEKHKLENFEFSQNYLAFWDKMEKSNCFLEHMIEMADRDPLDREMEFLLKDPISDGGWWCYVVALIEKYGVVPKDVMQETNSSQGTKAMNAMLARKLKVDALKLRKLHAEGKSVEQLRVVKKRMLGEVYRILVMNLGEPPQTFQWRAEDKNSTLGELRTYTPQKFYRQWVGVDLDRYVNISSDPSSEYGKHYRLDRMRNLYGAEDMHYVNVEIDVLKRLAIKSILDDEPVWFASDVGKDQSRQLGVMQVGLYDYDAIYGVETKMSKADRLQFREGKLSHAMTFIGVDLRGKRPVKWLVENSWGKDYGREGHWALYDEWFDEHVYSVIVKKEYVPKEVLKIFKQKPVVLPLWHPVTRLCQ